MEPRRGRVSYVDRLVARETATQPPFYPSLILTKRVFVTLEHARGSNKKSPGLFLALVILELELVP